VSITEQLKKAIRDHDGSVYSVSKGAGVPTPTLSRFMAGTRGIHGETVDKLAAFFGLELQPKAKPAKSKAKKT
jgi:plasmid maintenance system antidote protein VapI